MSEITAHHGLLRDIELHVEDTGGTGRPVVLIHGWPLSGKSWSHQVPALREAGYRVITYDRRGFGQSDKPGSGYDYDTFTEDLHSLLVALDLRDVTLVGFSMGGGEVARYFTQQGNDRLRSVVFASAVPPYLAKTPQNPDGPLDADQAQQMESGLKSDEGTFYDGFITQFFSVDGQLVVPEVERKAALALTAEADKNAALKSMEAFGTTDFREDLAQVTVPTLVIHGDGDAVVPFEGSGRLTHEQVANSELHVVKGGPHGINASHADEFNRVLLQFLAK